MSKEYILFDLDGTLLPMDQDLFVKTYFKRLAAKLAPYGYEPAQLIDAIWTGTAAMVRNNGRQTNENAFWNTFTGLYGQQALEHLPVFGQRLLLRPVNHVPHQRMLDMGHMYTNLMSPPCFQFCFD